MNRRCVCASLIVLALAMGGVPVTLVQAQTTGQELLSAAQQAFNDGFADVAVRYLEEFQAKFPESARSNFARLLLGQSYYLRGQYAQAQSALNQIVQDEENRDAVYFWLGEALLKQGQFVQARGYHQSLIKDFPLSPYVPQALYSLAWSYLEQKEFATAQSFFEQLLTLFPIHQLSEDAALKTAECAFNDGRFEEALRLFDAYLSRFPRSTQACAVQFDMAESHYYLERYPEARSFYQKVSSLECDDQQKWTAGLGEIWCAIKLKKFSEAQALFKVLEEFVRSKKMPQDDLAFVFAQLTFEQGDLEKAQGLFADFIVRFPQSQRVPEAYLARANIYFTLKKYEEAAADYTHIASSPDMELSQKARFGLGWAQLRLGHLETAIGYFNSVLEKSQDPAVRVNTLVQMGDAYQECGHMSEAVETYERVLKLYPGFPMADYVAYRRAIALLKADRVDDSLRALQDLRARFSSSPYLEDIDYYHGVASFKKGDWQAVIVTMERFLKGLLRPSEFTPQANYILALSYMNLRNPQEALRVFQKILRLYPDDLDVAKNAEIGIAKCQFELGMVKEAVKRFKLIVYKYPRTDVEEESLLWLAQYFLKNAEYPSAVDHYRAYVDRFPKSPKIDQAYYELGQAYEIQGQMAQALEQYQKITANDVVLTAKVKLAVAGILSKEFDPQKAIAAYENIIATNPDFASDAFVRLGQIYRNNQDYEKEIEVYQRALKSREGKERVNKAHLQFNIADTLELMSRTEEAIEYYLRIPHLYPQETEWTVKAYLRVAKIYEEGRDWEGAGLVYQKIIQLNTEEAKYAQERLEWMRSNTSFRKSK